MITILQTNDFHGRLTDEIAAKIAQIKAEEDALYFDCGDCIKAGNLAIPLRREEAWEKLKNAGCDAGVPGNRESHPISKAFEAKLDGAQHPLLCANIRAKNGRLPDCIHPTLTLEKNGLKLALFGVMVPIVTERMATQAASAYLWDNAIASAKKIIPTLQADRIIALTHIGFTQDIALAQACPEIDLILGAHSHTVVEEPPLVGKTRIFQAGSHGRYLGRYRFTDELELIEAKLITLSSAR